jgi:hypothetical protein
MIGRERAPILEAIEKGDFDEITRLAAAVGEFGYPKYDFNADFFYSQRFNYSRTKTTVLEFVLFGLFDSSRLTYSSSRNSQANVFEWVMFLAQLKNEQGDPIIDFNRAVLDGDGRRSPNLFSKVLTYNRWLHSNAESQIEINDKVLTYNRWLHSNAESQIEINDKVLNYAFEYLPEVCNFQLGRYCPGFVLPVPPDIFSIIREYYNPLECYSPPKSAGSKNKNETNPCLLTKEEILRSLNVSLTFKVLKTLLELRDSQNRPILGSVDAAFFLALSQNRDCLVPVITKKLIHYLRVFFESENLPLNINAMDILSKETALNKLDQAFSTILQEMSTRAQDNSFLLLAIEEIMSTLKSSYGGKRYLDLSLEERQQLEEKQKKLKGNREHFVVRQNVSPFRDRRILEIKFQHAEPSPEERIENVYYIYPKIRYGRQVPHYGILGETSFFVAPLGEVSIHFLKEAKLAPNPERLHRIAKQELERDMTHRLSGLEGRVPDDEKQTTEEEKEKIFLENLGDWVRETLKGEPFEIQRHILSKWRGKEDAMVREFIGNTQEELKAKLLKASNELRLSNVERENALMKQWFDERRWLHAYGPSIRAFKEIERLQRKVDEHDSAAYRQALKQINLLLDEVMLSDDELYISRHVWFCDEIDIKRFIELHTIECNLRKEKEEEFKQKSKAQKYIEACYQDLEGLSKSLDTYKKFREFIKKYNSEPEDQNIILSSLTRKIREQLFFKDNIPQIVIAVTKLEEILDQVPQQELSILKRFPIVEPVKEALEEEFKEINEQAISLYQEVVKCCLNMQEDYDVLQEVQLKEDEAIQSFVRCSVLKVEAVLSQKKSFQDIRNEVCSIKTDSLNCVSVYKDIISNYGTGNLIKLKNIAQTILQDPGVSLEDKQNKLRAWRKFIIAITENRGNNEETFSFLKEYFLWRISNLSDQELREVELIQILEQEKTSFEDLLKLEVNLKSVIDMQDYSRSVSLGVKRMAAMRSVWSAKIKIGKSGNPHFEEFANHTFIKARETLEKHRDNCAIRLLYALAVSVSSFLIYPFYICCRYRTFPLPTKGQMVLHDLEQSLNVKLAP